MTSQNLRDDFCAIPKINDIARWYVTSTVKAVAQTLPPDSLVLDAGAGECAYKHMFSHCKYRSIDLGVGDLNWNYSALDYIGPLDKMPIEDGIFDAVLCTQVLEHLEKPKESVAEMFRVLKPGGTLFLTVPLAQGEHQAPYDYFRYTSYGLKHICALAGFGNIEIKPLGGGPARIAYEIPALMSLFPSWEKSRYKVHVWPVFLIKYVAFFLIGFFQRILLWADKFDEKPVFPYGWALVATKPVKL